MRASKSLQMTIQGHVEEYNPDRCYNFGTPVVSEGAVYISGGYLTRVSPQDRWGQVPFVEMGIGCDVAVRVSEHFAYTLVCLLLFVCHQFQVGEELAVENSCDML